LKNIKKKSEEDFKKKQKKLHKEDTGSIDEKEKKPKRFKKIREDEFPKSYKTKG
jgi:hypothetical protein